MSKTIGGTERERQLMGISSHRDNIKQISSKKTQIEGLHRLQEKWKEGINPKRDLWTFRIPSTKRK